jgi:hypothetical protein
MIKVNILFANLQQETRELRLDIPWKKNSSQKDKLLYADGQLNKGFRLFADVSYLEETPYYGFGFCGPNKLIQIMPNQWEESEFFYDLGFFSSQKQGLVEVKKLLELFHLGD